MSECKFGKNCKYQKVPGPRGFICRRKHPIGTNVEVKIEKTQAKTEVETKNLCVMCNSREESKAHRYDMSHRCGYCRDLCLIGNMKFDEELDENQEKLIDERFKVVLTFKAIAKTHCGYCSDPSEIATTSEIVTRTRYLLNVIRDDDLDDDGFIDLECDVIKYYYKDDEGCNLGSEYCGCGTRYVLIKAQVDENKRKIVLGR